MEYLKENPDGIEKKDLFYKDDTAYPIGLIEGGKMTIGKGGHTHGMTDRNYKNDPRIDASKFPSVRDGFKYPGRFWREEKIMSFWEYPPRNKFFPLLPKIEKEWKRKFPDKKPIDFKKEQWYFEVWTYIKVDYADQYADFTWNHETLNILPLKDYFQVNPEDYKIEFRGYEDDEEKDLDKEDEKHDLGPPESVKTHTKRMTEEENKFRSIVRDIVRDVLK